MNIVKKRKQDAARQDKRRKNMREQGTPDERQVYRAIAFAVAKHILRDQLKGRTALSMDPILRSIRKEARAFLKAQDGIAAEEVDRRHDAVINSLLRRNAAKARDWLA